MIAAQPGSGPTVLRILLGSQLRMLREAKGVTREEAGYAIRASGSKISRMELGRVSFKERDVVDLLDLYGVDAEEAASLVALARQANYARLVAQVRRPAAGLVPGLCGPGGGRIPDPALRGAVRSRAAADSRLRPRGRSGSVSPRRPPEEIERRVGLRMGRQEAAHQAGRAPAVGDRGRGGAAPPDRRQGGDGRPARAADRGDGTSRTSRFRWCPSGRAAMPPRRVPSPSCGFPEPDLPDVVYLEQLTSALYLDKREDVEKYTEVMERLSVEGESPERTVDILSGMLEEVIDE